MKKPKVKYEIIGCEHRFVPSPETSKERATCNLKPEEGDCLVDIMTGERCYTQKKYYV